MMTKIPPTLSKYLGVCRELGCHVEEVRSALIAAGWTKSQIDSALTHYHSGKSGLIHAVPAAPRPWKDNNLVKISALVLAIIIGIWGIIKNPGIWYRLTGITPSPNYVLAKLTFPQQAEFSMEIAGESDGFKKIYQSDTVDTGIKGWWKLTPNKREALMKIVYRDQEIGEVFQSGEKSWYRLANWPVGMPEWLMFNPSQIASPSVMWEEAGKNLIAWPNLSTWQQTKNFAQIKISQGKLDGQLAYQVTLVPNRELWQQLQAEGGLNIGSHPPTIILWINPNTWQIFQFTMGVEIEAAAGWPNYRLAMVARIKSLNNLPHSPPISLVAPLPLYSARITQRRFGQLIITADKNRLECGAPFSGYHTGDDAEILPGEEDKIISVKAAVSGTISGVSWVSGYGGLIVETAVIGDEKYSLYYGHIDVDSALVKPGDKVTSGQNLASLGDSCSQATDGERRHLHFAVRHGADSVTSGYVNNLADLKNWIDPRSGWSSAEFQSNNILSP